MLAKYKTNTDMGAGLGLIGQVLGRVLINPAPHGHSQLGAVITPASLVAFIWGCAQYARGKGRSGWFGLFGFPSIIGLLVLLFLSDRHKLARA